MGVDARRSVQQEITRILLERFHVRLESAKIDLLETKVLDSVRIVDLVLELEQRFGVELPFEELEIEDFRTVGGLAERILRAPQLGG